MPIALCVRSCIVWVRLSRKLRIRSSPPGETQSLVDQGIYANRAVVPANAVPLGVWKPMRDMSSPSAVPAVP